MTDVDLGNKIDEQVKRFEQLKKREEELKVKEIQVSTMLENQKSEYKKSLDELKTKYNVSSLKEAQDLRDSWEKELKSKCDELDKALRPYESQEVSLNE